MSEVKKRTLNELRQVKEYGAGTAHTSNQTSERMEYPRTVSVEKIKSFVDTHQTIWSQVKSQTLFFTNQKRDSKEDMNIFGKIPGGNYKDLIENYQTKKGEDFNIWYEGLTNEEKIFITSMFD